MNRSAAFYRLWVLCGVRMGIAAIDLELAINRATEAVVRNHAAHRPFDQQLRMTRPPGSDTLGFVAAHVSGKAHIALLLFFFSGQPHFLGINHDNEVTSIDMRSEDGLLFATQQLCCLDGDAAEHLVLGVDDPPLARDLSGFGRKRFHRADKGGTKRVPACYKLVAAVAVKISLAFGFAASAAAPVAFVPFWHLVEDRLE